MRPTTLQFAYRLGSSLLSFAAYVPLKGSLARSMVLQCFPLPVNAYFSRKRFLTMTKFLTPTSEIYTVKLPIAWGLVRITSDMQ